MLLQLMMMISLLPLSLSPSLLSVSAARSWSFINNSTYSKPSNNHNQGKNSPRTISTMMKCQIALTSQPRYNDVIFKADDLDSFNGYVIILCKLAPASGSIPCKSGWIIIVIKPHNSWFNSAETQFRSCAHPAIIVHIHTDAIGRLVSLAHGMTRANYKLTLMECKYSTWASILVMILEPNAVLVRCWVLRQKKSGGGEVGGDFTN